MQRLSMHVIAVSKRSILNAVAPAAVLVIAVSVMLYSGGASGGGWGGR